MFAVGLSGITLLGLTAQPVFAEDAAEATPSEASESASSSESGASNIDSALRQDWGSYKVEWGANQYRGKKAAEEAQTAADSAVETAEASQESGLTREPPKALRSGVSEEGSKSTSLRSFEGDRPGSASSPSADSAAP